MNKQKLFKRVRAAASAYCQIIYQNFKQFPSAILFNTLLRVCLFDISFYGKKPYCYEKSEILQSPKEYFW